MISKLLKKHMERINVIAKGLKAHLELICKQKSCENWLKTEDDWLSKRSDIAQHFIEKFTHLFTLETNMEMDTRSLNDLIAPCITTLENEELMEIPQPEEIRDYVWSMHPLKSPGLDDFPRSFYRNYWEIIRKHVVKFVQETFSFKRIAWGINNTWIVLILKVKNATCFNHFRLINLCNFTYKIMSNIIANRLRKVISKIIALNQGAFVEGHWIVENNAVAQKLVHKVKNHKGEQGLMLMKIDL